MNFAPDNGITLARALYVAGAASAFGVNVAALTYARGALGLRRWAVGGAVIATGAGLAWLALLTFTLADAPTWPAWREALPAVAYDIRFGQALLAGLALLACSTFAHPIPAVMLGGAAVALHAVATHASATEGEIGTVVEAIHLLAAAIWLGGLPSLLLALRGGVAAAARRFAWVGVPAVPLLAVSGGIQLCWLAGGWPGLFGTGYGLLLLAKVVLFGAMLGLAILNRTLFATRPGWLVRSVALEATLGVLVIVLAASLAESLPGIHAVPSWPFPVRLTVTPLADPAMRWGALAGLAGSALALALFAGAVARRRLIPLTFAIILAVWSLPQLDIFAVEASPTSFAEAPPPTTGRIVAGAKLFASHCTACHGSSGRGNGPLAQSLPVRPADLMEAHVLQHRDGDLFWFVAHGLSGPNGAPAMPGFAPTLANLEVWDLLAFVHALNVGTAFAAHSVWPLPVLAPDFPLTCGDQTTTLSTLRGRIVRLALAPTPPSPRTVLILAPGVTGPDEACHPAASNVVQAYATLAGGAQGSEFLIDAQGWLRDFWNPADTNAVEAKLREIENAPPLHAIVPAGHVH